MLTAAWPIALIGCHGGSDTVIDTDTDGDADTDADTDSDTDTDTGDTNEWAPECPAGTSDIAGVCIAFPYDHATFTLAQAAAGLEIPYAVVVSNPAIRTLTALPQDAGGCGQPGPSGLTVFEHLTGSGGGYCLCDVGLCMGGGVASTLVDGVHRAWFAWDGRSWTGPSDFGNPKGDPLPAGDYTLTVSALASANDTSLAVSNSMTVTLTP